MKTVIFACVHNAGRSQMAAAFFNARANPALARALCFGTRPAERVHPEVVEAMRQVGLDVSAARPRPLTDDLAQGADLLVTMGCGEGCPWIAGLERQEWPFDDPKGRPPDEVRRIRDEIRERVEQLLVARGWARRD
jgi:arsenate reductase